MLLKRAARGQLPLAEAAQKVMGEVLSGPPAKTADGEAELVRNARKIALLAMGVAYQRYLLELEKQQEILMGLADLVMDVFAMESCLLRVRKTGAGAEISPVFLRDALARMDVTARNVLAACSEGDTLRTNLALLRRFAKYEPVDAVAARRAIAGRLLAAERYVA
jgi:butyryl-CoA dehydrogenase